MSERSDDELLAKLRAAEIKMGLVHTLVSISLIVITMCSDYTFTLGRVNS